MKIERKCSVCGNTFIAVNKQHKYCAECKTVKYKERTQRFKEAHPNYYKEYRKKNSINSK